LVGNFAHCAVADPDREGSKRVLVEEVTLVLAAGW
jgi:hypothetical protein